MMLFDPIRDFVRNLDRKEFTFWGSVYCGATALCIVIIIVRHVMVSGDIAQRTIQLNKSRTALQEIFTKYQVVAQQKNKVDVALKNNKSFNIQQFLQNLIVKYNLSSQVTSRFAQEKLPNGYFQESVVMSCTQITTEQLCELIVSIEQETLAYITFVDITRMAQAKKINVNISIATLRAEK